MKDIHLLCNAHLDPIWLWNWNEGAAEAISTFRVAADFCEKYDGFVFNHNESLLYEWIEEYEPDLFKRIQDLVKIGKWHIMGGWYLQPDCVMPSGESIIRQIRTGKEYFKEKFGVSPTTAINFDPFGHSRGLVQILAKTGYDSYIIMRPLEIENGDFIWDGFDGSSVICHKIYGGYNSLKGKAAEKIKQYLTENKNNSDEHSLILWGIGDHGGGASEIDLENIASLISEHTKLNIKHSTSEEYFKYVDKSKLKHIKASLVHCMVGCYTSMTEIKKLHRKTENDLTLCEKLLCHSEVDYDFEKLKEAEKALLLSEFHDCLPGTMVKSSEKDSIRLLGFAGEIADRLMTKAFFKLSEGQKPAKHGEIPILVYNPHPYEIKTEIEMEFQLEDQNWNENEVTYGKVYDSAGAFLPTQNEKEECTFSLDWRKKIVFSANLSPMSINRFDCVLETKAPSSERDNITETTEQIIVGTGNNRVVINKKTGLLDEYKINNKSMLKKNSGIVEVFNDNEDPWGMRVDSFNERNGSFVLMSDREANAHNGYIEEKNPNVRIVENGEVRTKIQALFKYSNSTAEITYIIPKNCDYIDISIKLNVNDVNKMFKYSIDTCMEDGTYLGQTMFGTEELLKDNKEVVFQKWCGLTDENSKICVLNKGTYGGSSDGRRLSLSLLRTPIYSAHPLLERLVAPRNRYLNHIDMGEHIFDFRILADAENIDYQAQLYNERLYALPFFPSGGGQSKGKLLEIDNKKIILSSLRRNKNSECVIRLYNSSDAHETTRLSVYGLEKTIEFTRYEVKTLMIRNGVIVTCDMLERSIEN